MEVSFKWQFTLKIKCVESFESEGYLDLKAQCRVFERLRNRKQVFISWRRHKTLKCGYFKKLIFEQRMSMWELKLTKSRWEENQKNSA